MVHANEYRVSEKASEYILYPNTALATAPNEKHIDVLKMYNIKHYMGARFGVHILRPQNMQLLPILKFKFDKWKISPKHEIKLLLASHRVPSFSIFFKT